MESLWALLECHWTLYHSLHLLVFPSTWKSSLVFVFHIFLLFWKFLNFLKIYFQGIYFAECLSTGVYKKRFLIFGRNTTEIMLHPLCHVSISFLTMLSWVTWFSWCLPWFSPCKITVFCFVISVYLLEKYFEILNIRFVIKISCFKTLVFIYWSLTWIIYHWDSCQIIIFLIPSFLLHLLVHILMWAGMFPPYLFLSVWTYEFLIPWVICHCHIYFDNQIAPD